MRASTDAVYHAARHDTTLECIHPLKHVAKNVPTVVILTNQSGRPQPTKDEAFLALSANTRDIPPKPRVVVPSTLKSRAAAPILAALWPPLAAPLSEVISKD